MKAGVWFHDKLVKHVWNNSGNLELCQCALPPFQSSFPTARKDSTFSWKTDFDPNYLVCQVYFLSERQI